jgi:hypothetical protein
VLPGPCVVVEEPAGTLAATNTTGAVFRRRPLNQFVARPLMIPFVLVTVTVDEIKTEGCSVSAEKLESIRRTIERETEIMTASRTVRPKWTFRDLHARSSEVADVRERRIVSRLSSIAPPTISGNTPTSRVDAEILARPAGLGTRTCDPRLRSSAKGGNQGQHNTAAPDFIDVLSNPRPPETAPNRYALSVICQSTFACR